MTSENSPSKVADGRPAVQPFHFGRRRDQRGIVRLRRAVDDEGRARQRLEHGGDVAVGVEIMRPGGAAAQRQDAVRHRERLVGADAEFAARRRDVLGGIVQREGAGARQHLLGIGRQADRW